MSVKTRLALVHPDQCKPEKCQLECRRICPVVKLGRECVTVTKKSKQATILEETCTGCGLCVKKCPFDAIRIINLPNALTVPVLFRYGRNQFQLHRLPQPRRGQVLGLLGANGMGKSTLIKLMAGKLHPNFGGQEKVPLDEIIHHFRGSDLQNYLGHLYQGSLKCTVKPQMIEYLAKTAGDKTVNEVLSLDIQAEYHLDHLGTRRLSVLSGGELQRVAIAKVCHSDSQVYLFDEPTNFLDIKQRMIVGHHIRQVAQASHEPYVMVVDHDVALLDFMSDYLSCLYGVQGAYGVVSLPATVREGINQYLQGFLPAENMRIRDELLRFVRPLSEEEEKEMATKTQTFYDYSYSDFTVRQGTFQLTVEGGGWNQRDIVLLVGQNGMGKTTLVRALSGLLSTVPEQSIPSLHISYKPQQVTPHFQGTVQQLLHAKIGSLLHDSLFQSDVLELLKVPALYDKMVPDLSGGELQRVAITLALGKPADLYLLDEPNSSLDIEMRLSAATAIRRYIKHRGKSAFIVEHDLVMGIYLADKVIAFTGAPGVQCQASAPLGKELGMNTFLRDMNLTIRQDPETFRPRLNKPHSQLDQEQKQSGQYFQTTASVQKIE